MTTQSLQIRAATPEELPLELLLLADPSEAQIHTYLADALCLIAEHDQAIVGAAVIQNIGMNHYELKNLAVLPYAQRQGIGSQLLQHLFKTLRTINATRLDVGTGSFGYPLAFYQKVGFRVHHIKKDFFLTHYAEPIFEEGIQHKDMLCLTLDL